MLALLTAVWTLTSCFPLGFLHMYSYKSLGFKLGWFVMKGSSDFNSEPVCSRFRKSAAMVAFYEGN